MRKKRTSFNKLNLKHDNIDRALLYALRAYDGFEFTRKMFTSRGVNPRFKEYFKVSSINWLC